MVADKGSVLVVDDEAKARSALADGLQGGGHRVETAAEIVGDAPIMRGVLRTVAQAAPTRASVLVTGESGTGKELIAAAIHQRSSRAREPFVKLRCAALAESVLERELFGHERGAFAGAVARRDGRLRQASGGTLFLDEISEISPAIQVKLLDFIQERRLERVGGDEPIPADVRVVAATNRDLRAEVAHGRFREDLFYRLSVITIEMPALRERPSDIPLLAKHFLRRYAAENGVIDAAGTRTGKTIDGFTAEALARLRGYPWPGNIRELETVVERAVVLCDTPCITAADLPSYLAPPFRPEGLRIPGSTLGEVERHAILKTLESTGGSTQKAAELLGISVRKIQYKLREYRGAPSSSTRDGATGGGARAPKPRHH